jgi:Ca-activated chloride channel family protein
MLRAWATTVLATTGLLVAAGCGEYSHFPSRASLHETTDAEQVPASEPTPPPPPDNRMRPHAPPAGNHVQAPAPLPVLTRPDTGRGPGRAGDRYALTNENSFVSVNDKPLSTFSIDVDTASYTKTRMYLLQKNALPPVDAVRVEEFINYFAYDYPAPAGREPFAVHVELAPSPWQPSHQLARIGIQGRRVDQRRPPCNLVFLLDVSGSMDYPNKLPLVQQGLRMLVSQLRQQDHVAIAVYAGAAGVVLPPTPGDQQHVILQALNRLQAGGSTNGGDGIRLAYQLAKQYHVEGGVNRVLLCTDGDFNVGTTSTSQLVRLAAQQAGQGVFLSVLGFGMGNHNDALLEQMSNEANGNYAFVDTQEEARKVLVDQLQGTLVTIAKDVKLQVEFNPARVSSYRLIGYENRQLAAQDFRDDSKDAGDIGAGHTVTALYELVPRGSSSVAATPKVDPLKYQASPGLLRGAASDEWMTVKIRYKEPNEDVSRQMSFAVENAPAQFVDATPDHQFATAVAAFAMLLRRSPYCGDLCFDSVQEIASAARGHDMHGYRAEFLQMVAAARQLTKGSQPFSVASPAYRPTSPVAPAHRPHTVVRTPDRRTVWQMWLVPLLIGGVLWGLCVGLITGGIIWHIAATRPAHRSIPLKP